ncbi:hypothetical protein EAE99_008787 [Botrytis elliptica]|nr:hypothetical protein EAE99_008787 [Botrytis elliptica]
MAVNAYQMRGNLVSLRVVLHLFVALSILLDCQHTKLRIEKNGKSLPPITRGGRENSKDRGFQRTRCDTPNRYAITPVSFTSRFSVFVEEKAVALEVT